MDWNLSKRIIPLWEKYRYFLLVLLIGIGFMLFPSQGKDGAEEMPQQQEQTQENLEQRLEKILSQLSGAGQVRVLLTQLEGEQILYQENKTESGSEGGKNQSSQTVLITNGQRGQEGLVQQIIQPKYQGAIVLCHGADNPQIKLAIVEAVANATGLPSSRISVLKMRG